MLSWGITKKDSVLK